MRRYARALITEALANPGLLLEREKFWRLDVFAEFLAEITKALNANPAKALELSKFGPSFAQLVAASTDHGTGPLQSQAYNHLGSGYFVVGDLASAEEAFDQAETFDAPLIERADTHRRRAFLRVYQGRPEEAYDLANLCVVIHERHGDLFNRQPLGLALSARGYAHYQCDRPSESATDLSAAGGLINYRTHPQAYYDVLHNLTVVMVDVIAPDQLSQTLNNLEACYRRLIGQKQTIARHKIRWARAIVEKRFGATRKAEKHYKIAFNAFVDLGAASEVAMIALDIALLFTEELRLAEARKLATDAYKIVEGLGMGTSMLAALKIWVDATTADLTPELLANVRQRVVKHANPYGLIPPGRPTVDATARV